jgi:hypothetical protein
MTISSKVITKVYFENATIFSLLIDSLDSKKVPGDSNCYKMYLFSYQSNEKKKNVLNISTCGVSYLDPSIVISDISISGSGANPTAEISDVKNTGSFA